MNEMHGRNMLQHNVISINVVQLFGSEIYCCRSVYDIFKREYYVMGGEIQSVLSHFVNM
jgi:hypothetical protein